jgi:predicted nucleic acid-binding protein
MHEAISDIGPILHLHEIDQLNTLSIFERLSIPGLVADELRAYGLNPLDLCIKALSVVIVPVSDASRNAALTHNDPSPIQPADAEVFVLAQSESFQKPVLTDDLALRRRLEKHGAVVVGSVGVLVRAIRQASWSALNWKEQ